MAILSLGSPVVMDFTPHSRLRLCTLGNNDGGMKSDEGATETKIETDKWQNYHHPFSILLMPRSLLIFKDEAYSDYLHGIKDSEVQAYDAAVNVPEVLNPKEAMEAMCCGNEWRVLRTTNRVSLTCRLVLKVHKNLFKF